MNEIFKNLKIRVFSIFALLIPIFLISGPFLTDLSVFILSISFFFLIRDKKFFLNYFFIIFLIFWLITLLSSILADNKILAIKSSFFYIRFCLFSLIFWFLIESNKKLLKQIFFIISACFFLLVFDSIFQSINGENIFFMKIVEEGRVSSFFGDELKMGGYLMRFTPLLFALSLYYLDLDNNFKFQFIGSIIIFLISISIFLSGERTSFFLFILTIVFFLLFLNKLKILKICIIFFGILSSIVLIISENNYKKRIIDLTLKQSNLGNTTNQKFIFSRQYNEHYISAWRIFKDNKFLGIGPKNFREKCKEEKYNISELTCSTHPHNIPLQLLSETGLLGFFIYFIFYIFIWLNLIKSFIYKILFKKTYLNNFQISLLISLAISFWPLSPSGNFFNNWISAVYYFQFSIFLWSFKKSKKMYLKSSFFNLKKIIFLDK